MKARELIRDIGPIMQLAFVPDDFDAALVHWTENMGVGPFFWIEHAGLENARFQGVPSSVDFGLALGYWGDIQIELIKQHNDAPSIYTTAPYARKGLHHVCVLTQNISQAKGVALESGAHIVFDADVSGGGRVFYADPAGDHGLIEVLETSPKGIAFFDTLKQAARDWDGSEPLRRLG